MISKSRHRLVAGRNKDRQSGTLMYVSYTTGRLKTHASVLVPQAERIRVLGHAQFVISPGKWVSRSR